MANYEVTILYYSNKFII